MQRGVSTELLHIAKVERKHFSWHFNNTLHFHMNLLTCVHTAAENLAAQRGVSTELLHIAKVESKHFSLPFNIKSQVENSNGMPSMLKVCGAGIEFFLWKEK